jgi:hypothetical protein
MLDEPARRHPGFRDGTAVRLADGQEWVFPDPLPLTEAGTLGPDYSEILKALAEVQGEEPDEILRAELALGICLLSHNYTLASDDFLEVLGRKPGEPALRSVYDGLHAVAQAHLRAYEVDLGAP